MNKFEQVCENGGCGFPMWIGGLRLRGVRIEQV